MTPTKSGHFQLPLFKQGDDLGYCLEHSTSVDDGLEQYAALLTEAAAAVRQLKAAVAGKEVELWADCHSIEVSGRADLIDGLIREGILAEIDQDDNDEEEEI